jgi:hypothetical protein
MQLEMIPCPKCGNDFPKKRKELGYHVCINCSTVKPVIGVTTVEGSGDHTYNDLIIMDQDKFRQIAEKQAELSGHKANLELLDYDTDESEINQAIHEKVSQILEDEEDEESDEILDPDAKPKPIQGIDY